MPDDAMQPDDGDAAEREAADAEAHDPGDEAERKAAEAEVREAEEEDHFGIDQKRMPFTAHLVELRFRILVILGTVTGAFILFFFLLSPYVYDVMTLPVLRACEMTEGVEFKDLLVSRKPTEMFVTSALMCLLAAVILTIPVTLYQVWEFVAPGLKRKERKAVVPILSVGSGLFILGTAFAYFVVVPVAMQYLMGYTLKYKGVKLLWNIGDTLKFESVLLLVFGFAFEMPLVVVALTRVGILSPEMLARKRRHCIVAMFIIGALLTPPDVVTQICLAVPLVILFEISIFVSKFFRRKHTIWEGWDDDGGGGGGAGGGDDTLGREWDREAAAADAAGADAAGTDVTDASSPDHDDYTGEYEDYSEGEYYDEWQGDEGDPGDEAHGEGMGDDIDQPKEEKGEEEDEAEGPAGQFPDEDASPEDGASPEDEDDGDKPPTEDKPT